jgi:glycosyltransferase involved in cell wall biosynthesis
MKNRVTWLLPVKNAMPYLPETLASIEAQTYTNWEVLAWDDGSTDGTLEELKKWIPSRLPGRVIEGTPSGVGAALATLVEESTTELCARIDGDDINMPERLEEQVAFLENHPDVALVGSQFYALDEQGVANDTITEYDRAPLNHDDIVHSLFTRNTISHPSVMFRRSVVLDVGNYHALPNVEDYDLWLRMAVRHKLANLNRPLIFYRLHSKSETRSKIREGTLQHLADECLAKHAPSLFGCTEDEARLLRKRQHPLSISILYKIAKHLHQTQGGTLMGRFRSHSFIEANQFFILSNDVFSRLVFAILSGQKSRLAREVISVTKSMIFKLPGTRKWFQSYRRHYSEQS